MISLRSRIFSVRHLGRSVGRRLVRSPPAPSKSSIDELIFRPKLFAEMLSEIEEGGNDARGREVAFVLLAQAATGVGPFEASGQNVADIAEVEEEERHPYYRVHYSHDFAPFRPGTNVAVTCAVNENAAK